MKKVIRRSNWLLLIILFRIFNVLNKLLCLFIHPFARCLFWRTATIESKQRTKALPRSLLGKSLNWLISNNFFKNIVTFFFIRQLCSISVFQFFIEINGKRNIWITIEIIALQKSTKHFLYTKQKFQQINAYSVTHVFGMLRIARCRRKMTTSVPLPTMPTMKMRANTTGTMYVSGRCSYGT